MNTDRAVYLFAALTLTGALTITAAAHYLDAWLR